jgi:hypothetical protein
MQDAFVEIEHQRPIRQKNSVAGLVYGGQRTALDYQDFKLLAECRGSFDLFSTFIVRFSFGFT